MFYILCKKNRKASSKVYRAQVKHGRIYSVSIGRPDAGYYHGIYFSWQGSLFDIIAKDNDLLSIVKMYNTGKKIRALP